MPSLTATRSELLVRRSRAAFAEQGRDLLKDKRLALVLKFQRHRQDLLHGLEQLRVLAVTARKRLDDALAADGPVPVRSAALSAATGIEVAVNTRTVAGVQVFDLDRGPVRRSTVERGWATTLVSARIAAAADSYEELLERLLDLCVVELSMRRLAFEIARATRQVNALDNVLLPRMRAEAHSIVLILDEREREEHARLRRARARRNLRNSAAESKPGISSGGST